MTGYRLNNDYEADDVYGSVTIKPVDYFDATFTGSYHRDWYGMPGALYRPNLISDGREGSRFPDSKAKTEDYYFTVDPRIYGEVDDHEVVFSTLFSYRNRRALSRSVSFNVYETNHHITSFDIRPKVEVNSDFFEGSMENKLVCGADYFHAKDLQLSGDTAFTMSQVDAEKDTLGIYLSDTFMWEKRFIVNCGIRGEWAEYAFDQNKPSASIDEKSLREMAYDAGLGFKYNERSQVYFSYAKAYRFPGTDEYFQAGYESLDWSSWPPANRIFPAVLNIDLEQQTGNNFEIGLKDNSLDFLKLNAACFFIDNRNEIYLDPYTPENPENDQNENYHDTEHYGFEFESALDLLERITAFLNYTYQKSYFVGGKYNGKLFPLVPEHNMSAGIDIKPVEGLVISYSMNMQGIRHAANDLSNTVSRIESYVTHDISASYRYENIKVYGVVRNIFDEAYYSNQIKSWNGSVALYPAEGVNFEFGITFEF